jgi:hypothetical protein
MQVKMEIRPCGAPVVQGTFTDEHAACSYGLPVFVAEDGRVLGPGDLGLPYGDHLYFPEGRGESEQPPDVIRWLEDYIVSTWGLSGMGLAWVIPQLYRGRRLLDRIEKATGRRVALNRMG